MEYMLQCYSCGFTFKEDAFYNECPRCGGMVEAVINDITNATIDDDYDTILKYHHFWPIEDPASLAAYESAESTPIIQGDKIAEKYGFNRLLLKDETVMETGTMKDREGLLTINRLLINNIDGLVLASSGNAGIAIAWYASKIKGPKVYLYLPECSRERMEDAIEKFTSEDIVKVIYVEGSTDEAGEHARQFAKEQGLPYGTGFKNYSRREGVKTFTLEYLFEQSQRADWYVQGVAGALAIYAFYKTHKELGIPCPKIAGIQPSACSPFVDALKDNADELTEAYIPPEPVVVPEAPVLKTRKPVFAYPIIKNIIDEVNGYFEKVTAEEIRQALQSFYLEDYFIEKYKKTGVRVGLEASTALAGIIKMKKNGIIWDTETVLVNVSGAARPGDIPDEWWEDIEP